MIKRRLRSRLRLLKRYAKEKPFVLITYLILRFFVLAALVFSCINGSWDSAFLCVLVLILFIVPALLETRFPVEFPSVLQIVILVFIFAAEILGELSSYYVRFRYWDTILHCVWGFLCAAVGYSLVDLLNRDERVKLQLSPIYLAVGAFCFSMTIGVIWEFFEFAMDYFFHLDMQKDTVIHAFSSVSLDLSHSNLPVRLENITDVTVNGENLGLGGYLDIGLYDTIEDLFVNFVGALTFSIIGYFDARRPDGSRITRALTPRRQRSNPES